MTAFDKPLLIRILMIIALAWGGPTLALALGRLIRLPGGSALGLALAGGALALALGLWSTRLNRKKPLKTGAGGDRESSWNQIADPKANYANRWAMYQNLSAWLGGRDWNGKAVVEFGHTNDVLSSFLKGSRQVLLEYPQHDVQDLAGVASDQFDLAILDQTLEHVADPERALGEVRRVLKPGGIAIVTTPFLVPLHDTQDYGDYTRWTPQGMETMLGRCGFEAQVFSWGNLSAARELLGSMHLTASEAMARKLPIAHEETEARYPVTVWATATAKK